MVNIDMRVERNVLRYPLFSLFEDEPSGDVSNESVPFVKGLNSRGIF